MTLNTSALAAKSQKIKDIFVQTFVFPKSPAKGIAFCELSPPAHQEYELTSYNDIRQRKENVGFDSDEALSFAEGFNQPNQDGDMKFSHSIQFNAVPDWGSQYIAYSNLKKLIYQLEKSLYKQNSDDVEHAPLISLEEPDEIFKKSLDAELEKITSFYLKKELEIFQETADLIQEAGAYESGLEQNEAQEQSTLNFPKQYRDRPRTASLAQNYLYRPQAIIGESIDEGIEESEDDNENTALNKSKSKSPQRRMSLPNDSSSFNRTENRHRRKESFEFLRFNRRLSQISDDDYESDSLFYSAGITLRKRTINLFVQLCELKSFLQLNKTGFVKVLKKYDKIMNRNLKDNYISIYVSTSKPFLPSTAKNIENKIEVVEQVFAKLVTNGDLTLAKRELRLNLRQHVVWERNTVWREMIGLERKAQAVHLGLRRTILGADNRPDFARLQGDDDQALGPKQGFTTRYGRLYLPQVLLNSSFLFLIAIVLIFIILLRLPMNLQVEEQNCLAMLVFVSLLWATEAIPLFVTALIIPFLCVVLRIVRSDEAPHYRLNPSDATKYIFAAMWTPVIMLLLGGFTIAAALSKYDIARRIATFVLSKAGNNPNVVLITNMFVAAFASMWISNVAAPVLCFSIIQPLLRNIPPESQMSKALLLGIALASNIGGMLSPIASPQNIVGLQIMDPPPSWGGWFFVALPVGIISIFLIWLILLVSFRPCHGTTIVPIRSVKDKFTGIQWFISISTLFTIVLWCMSHQLQWILGDMGVIAILPIVLFFGSGILSKEDFNNFLWTIIILAAGGLSLGKAVSSSGLLHTVAGQITERVENFSTYGIFVVFITLTLCVATFISHTVAALIILPLVHRVGMNMTVPHPNLLVMGCALTCSAAMGLPTSGFPNMTAIMMENPQTGQRYLKVDHFLSRGIPASIVTLIIIITVGYGTMSIIGL